MDPKKAEMKNIGNKISDENIENSNKDVSEELENIKKITTSQEPQPVIKLKQTDIDLIQSELDITYDEAKVKLIKCQGDVKKVIDTFLNDFNIDK